MLDIPFLSNIIHNCIVLLNRITVPIPFIDELLFLQRLILGTLIFSCIAVLADISDLLTKNNSLSSAPAIAKTLGLYGSIKRNNN
jgi:hypothetical protein